ncbi:MAG: type II toxin-antitoxin system HicB family antitoxin [Chitinophagaceae bacterium]
MKEHSRFSGKLLSKTHPTITVKMDLIEYEENSIFYVFSPALDLIGYGKTQQEARDSWQTVLEEYFSYTMNKKTLVRDLETRGWVVKRNKKQFTPPTFSWMLQNNEQLTEVYNKHDFKKVTEPISMPYAYA